MSTFTDDEYESVDGLFYPYFDEETLAHAEEPPIWSDYTDENGNFDEVSYDTFNSDDCAVWCKYHDPETYEELCIAQSEYLSRLDKPYISSVLPPKEPISNEALMHYGTPRHSGRYPWGSGETPYQHESYFLDTYSKFKAMGYSDTKIAECMGMKTPELRARKSYAINERKASDIRRVREMHDKGMSNVAIGKVIGKNESVVRGYLKDGMKYRTDLNISTANMLRDQIKEKGFIDIGVGSERYMGITETRLKTAVQILKDEGYSVYGDIKVPQATNPNQKTTVRVICGPGVSKKEAYLAATTLDENGDSNIKSVTSYSIDNGKTFLNLEKPSAFSSSRLQIRYKEEGGKDMDGVIQLRRGVDDISLGGCNYAQVRINVDDTHYLKGMAMYTDDLPDGVDIRFNTNKPIGTPIFRTPEMSKNQETVLKPMKTIKNPDGTQSIDWDNPFGSAIKEQGQRHFTDAQGKDHLSVINKVNEEGDWNEWSKTLSSQFLSKQSNGLIKRQLESTYAEKLEEFDKICALTNPEIKKKLLESFADDCDSSAVHLKANSLPRQSQKVILPINSLKDNEVYAPSYKDGERVVLIRYPHAGKFEIPELVVNNKNKEAIQNIGRNPIDAIGINTNVAGRLSGADFDGDSVVVIPVNDRVKILTEKPLAALKDFDPSESYPFVEGMKVMSKGEKQTEMGKISNLITDMTIKGADSSEIARAVKHSMVVIDAEKHKLNYKLSEKENGIAELRALYQRKPDGSVGGASTLISKAKSKYIVNERTEGKKVTTTDPITGKTTTKILYWDPETGEKLYRDTGRQYDTRKRDDNGKYIGETQKMKTATEETTKMANALQQFGDARTLISDTDSPVERYYADYANKVYALANEARKTYLATKDGKYNAEAAKKYSAEVKSLKDDLDIALKNAPRERQAQLVANAIYQAKLKDNPDMKKDKAEQKKIRNMALKQARERMGASRSKIDITPERWEVIQSRAISSSMLKKILDNCDQDQIREYATPKREANVISPATQRRIRAMSASGHTMADIAEALGVSTSTISKYIKE